MVGGQGQVGREVITGLLLGRRPSHHGSGHGCGLGLRNECLSIGWVSACMSGGGDVHSTRARGGRSRLLVACAGGAWGACVVREVQLRGHEAWTKHSKQSDAKRARTIPSNAHPGCGSQG